MENKAAAVTKNYLRLFGLICLTIGFVLGVYAGLTKVVIPLIFATSQSSVSEDTDTDFSQGTLSSTEVSGSGTGAVVQLQGGGGSDWYNSNWQYRKKITIDHTKVSADLTNFPILVSLTSDSDLAADAQSDGDDILFADTSKTKLDHEIEKFDSATGELVAWVKIPSLSSTTDTDIYLYYGNASASNQQNATGVWDSNYAGVWHLNETSGNAYDSTSNGVNMTNRNGVDMNITGKINGAGGFEAAGAAQHNTTSTIAFNTSLTLEGWFYRTGSDNSYPRILELSANGNANSHALAVDSDGSLRAWTQCSSGRVGSADDSTQYPNNTWTYFVYTYDGTTGRIYVNGNQTATGSGSCSDVDDTADVIIGAISDGSGQYSLSQYDFDGNLDEMRVSTSVRSADWISTEYNNQNSPSTFYSLAAEETALPSSGTWVSATDANVIDLVWNGGWGDGTDSSTAFSATVASVGANSSITFQMRVASSVAGLSSASYVTVGVANSGTSFTKTKADLDTLGLGTGSNRYVQVKATLSSSDGVTNPQLDTFTIYYLSDNTAPETNASSIAMKKAAGGASVSADGWTNGSSPYFSWTAGADSQAGLKGYCLYLGTDSNGNPATAKGLLGTSPVSTSGTTCQFIVSSTSIDFATAAYKGSTWLTSSSSEYYLNIKAIDNSGNIVASSASFSFYFDNTAPSNPSYLSLPGDFVATKSATITWPSSGSDAASDSHSGIAGLQYRIGSSGTWYGDSHTGNEDADDLLANDGSYATVQSPDFANIAEGSNLIYLRTWDNAGNVSSTYISGALKVNTTSPSSPQSLAVTPSTSTSNSYAFSWAAPATYTGQVGNITYCYTVNSVPSATACTWTSAGTTSLSADAYATQPSTNTFYLVAKDEAGNVNYDTYASVSFTYSGSAPGIPRNADIADISIKSTSNWKLTISWDAPSDVGAGVSTYKVYRGTTNTTCSSSFSSFTNVGSTAGTAYTDTGLSQQTYYYCLKACDSANNCGAVSSTVSKKPTGKYTSAASLTSGPTAGSITTKKAKITWSTDRSSDSKIQYGTSSGSYLTEEPSNSTQTTDHAINLTNLSAGTTYYYKAKWTDEDGNTGTSSEKSFTTSPAPTVKDVTVSNIGLTSAIINYTTKDASKVKIYYGKTTSFGGSKEISTSTSETSYSTQLSDLEDGVKYYYKINSFDSESSEYEGTILDFQTLPRPKISKVQLQEIKGTAQPAVLVSWVSNTEISSIVTYYPEGELSGARDEVNIKLVKGEHKMLLKGLLPHTNYILIAKGRDKIGNEARSDTQKFTTATDTRPPVISDLKVEGVIQGVGEEAQAQLLVSFNTDEPATSQVEFGEGTGTAYSQKTQESANLTLNHLVVISNLTPSKVYHLRAMTKDQAANETKSVDTVTITPKATQSALNLVVGNLSEIFGFLGGRQ